MRATLDKLISATGLLMAIILLAAGAGLLYTASFIGGQVEQILGAEKINMPTEEAINGDDALSPEDKEAMMEHAGSEMDTGEEARAYANHYIYAHLMHSTGGETYSTLGPKVTEACGENRENADSQECQQLSGLRDTAQKASALRTVCCSPGWLALWQRLPTSPAGSPSYSASSWGRSPLWASATPRRRGKPGHNQPKAGRRTMRCVPGQVRRHRAFRLASFMTS